MSRPFARSDARRPVPQPRRIATINGRPAWEVVAERKAAEQQECRA